MAVELSLRYLFQDFNHSKVVVYTSLFLFLILFALREDNLIRWPYWAIFIPLWVWKFLALSGGIVGCIIYKMYPPNRNDYATHIEYQGMVLSFAQHLLLLMFEIMVCYKLDSQQPILWLLVFVPLLFQCLLAIPISIWSLKHEKTYEFEIVFAVNVLQATFVALKLDDLINWPWVIVFVPLWILICLCLMLVLYAVVSAIMLIRSVELMADHRRHGVYSAVNHTLLVVPILVFLVLLTNKLDVEIHLPYLMVFTPIYVSLICLIVMACGTKGGNQWWFGIRREFCQFLLTICPCMREYGNVTYRFRDTNATSPMTTLSGGADRQIGDEPNTEKKAVWAHLCNKEQQKPVVLVLPNSIDCPD